MDLIKEIVCDDIYHIIEEYLKQVIVFKVYFVSSRDIYNSREESIFKISCDINMLIYLDSINSTCITRRNKHANYGGSRKQVRYRKSISKCVETIYTDDTYQIRVTKRSKNRHRHVPRYPRESRWILHNKTRYYNIRLTGPKKNYAIDFKTNKSQVLHPDIIDYYCNLDYNCNPTQQTNGQIDMYFSVIK